MRSSYPSVLVLFLFACGGESEEAGGVSDVGLPAGSPTSVAQATAGTGGATVTPSDPLPTGMPVDTPVDAPVDTPVDQPTDMGGAGTPPVDPATAPPNASTGCGATDWPMDGPGNFDIEGMTREYIITLPAGYDPNVPHKLIFAWHGLGGTAEQIASGFFGRGGYYGLENRAGGTAIFATGQGLPALGGGAGWSSENDFPFVQTLMNHIKSNYCVDEARVFSTGASYGGIQSNRIGCRFADQFRAIAPIMGSGPASFFGGTTCPGQVAAWITHGRMDATVTFDQGEGSRDFWVAANHCAVSFARS